MKALEHYLARGSDNVSLYDFVSESNATQIGPALGSSESDGMSPAAKVFSLIELVERIASFMMVNDVSCTLRLVNKATAAHLRSRTGVRLSQPVPPHAFAHRWGAPGAARDLSIAQRKRLLRMTAGTGVVANLRVAMEAAGCTLHKAVFEQAAAAGKLEACTWLRQRECPWGWAVLAAAAHGGHLEILQWLHDGGCPSDPAVFDAAASAGQRQACEWLRSHHYDWSFWALVGAARGGHVELMLWLLEELLGPGLLDISLRVLLLEGVAAGCDLATLQRLRREWLVDAQGRQLSLAAPQEVRAICAAAGGTAPDWRDKATWLLERVRGGPRVSYTLEGVVGLPDALERIKWLTRKVNRGVADSNLAASVAATGNVPLLEFLLDKGIVPDEHAASDAAEAGHLGVLKLLRARGARLGGKESLLRAAKGGHLEVLTWLAEAQGLVSELPASSVLLLGAAEGGCAPVLAWLRQRGCDWARRGGSMPAGAWPNLSPMLDVLPADDGEPYLLAVENGDLATLRCLAAIGCPWGKPGHVFARAVEFAPQPPLPLLACLLGELRCVAVWGEARAAAARRREGREEVAAWVRQQQRLERESAAELD